MEDKGRRASVIPESECEEWEERERRALTVRAMKSPTEAEEGGAEARRSWREVSRKESKELTWEEESEWKRQKGRTRESSVEEAG